MTRATIPTEFVNRTAALAAVVGHLGLKISPGLHGRRSELPRASFLNELLWPFLQRAGRALVACSRTDVKQHPMLQEILTPDGPDYRLSLTEACTSRFMAFWTGEIFSSDRTIITSLPISAVVGDPIVEHGTDPFVMQNLNSFMGGKGVHAVQRVGSESPDQVVCALVGPPSELFFFAPSTALTQLVPLIFDRCEFTAQFQNYVRGPFVPIDDVLKRLRPKSSRASGDS